MRGVDRSIYPPPRAGYSNTKQGKRRGSAWQQDDTRRVSVTNEERVTLLRFCNINNEKIRGRTEDATVTDVTRSLLAVKDG